MTKASISSTYLTRHERFFNNDEIIVSKTDLKGRITYANPLFMKLADMGEKELLGAPHSIIRHPEMPRCVFKLLWDTLEAKREIFAYVVNRSANGDHYWVLAHATPTFDGTGNITGYHSSRRVPDKRIVSEIIAPLYQTLLAEETRHANAKDGMAHSTAMLLNILKSKGIAYDEFVFSL
ncbi:MAG: PAS domain-containing protein [Rhodospirillales bacterium]|nr:PAS domain-containing protein [Alphaproteobacteria bacterium]MCB9987483.1 PAS domain-containing protein [Rhodospirillales bacterium]USO07542.1 MAG: PAS domain-containing protein [Rhodospirillales bacterium]